MLTTEEKLELALKALELADGIMDYCGGDSWERECTADDRKEYQRLYAILNPPAPPVVFVQPKLKLKTPQVVCEFCGQKCRGDLGVLMHIKHKHSNGG